MILINAFLLGDESSSELTVILNKMSRTKLSENMAIFMCCKFLCTEKS